MICADDTLALAAGAVWTNTMPQKLAEHLPGVNATARAELFGSITDVLAFPYDDPTRQGVIAGAFPPPSPSPSLPPLSLRFPLCVLRM